MFKQILSIFILLIIIFHPNCGKNKVINSVVNPQDESTFTLMVGEERHDASGTLTIGFDTVYSNSRIDTTEGFIHGIAYIRIWLHQRDTDTVFVDMSIYGSPKISAAYYKTVDTLGFLITLVKLEPIETPQTYNNYKATLQLIKYNRTGDFNGEIIPTSLPPKDIFNYYYGVYDVSITADSLNIRLVHGGGCAPHYYLMYMSPLSFAKSQPVQANLYVRHFNNGDFCEALLHPWLKFDLSTIKQLYQEQYSESGEILLNIYEWDNELLKAQTVLYSF